MTSESLVKIRLKLLLKIQIANLWRTGKPLYFTCNNLLVPVDPKTTLELSLQSVSINCSHLIIANEFILSWPNYQ